MFHVPNQQRVRTGQYASDNDYGNNGVFIVPLKKKDLIVFAQIVASDGSGWEHVSVTILDQYKVPTNRTPTWDDMCKVKDIFWDGADAVMQLHPPHADYINNHAACLHLWRPTRGAIPLPSPDLVGLKSFNLK
jgi:hypothetical protein